MFRNQQDATSNAFALVLKWGGLGDQIARFTAIRYLLNSFPKNRYFIFCPTYVIPLYERFLEGEKLNTPNVQILDLGLYKEMEKRNLFDFGTDFEGDRFTAMRMSLVDNAWIHVNDRLPRDDRDREYPFVMYKEEDQWALPSKYVVLTTMFTAPNRAWLAAEVNKTAKGLIERGYNVVFLGAKEAPAYDGLKIKAKDDGVDYSLGLDLRDRTNLLQAAFIMDGAECVLGVDNGLLHLASCTSVPRIIWGFTNVEPSARIPVTAVHIEHGVVEPEKSLACRFCQTNINWQLTFDNKPMDFRKCLYSDYVCLSHMKAEFFLERFDSLREAK